MALPLAMAFSIASGLTPQAGIYCAIVTGFLISALGGSKTQIGGPDGRLRRRDRGHHCCPRRGWPVHVHGDGRRSTGHPGRYRNGTAVKFIPRPVVIGFTNGIAVLIASTQIKDFFGLHLQQSARANSGCG